MKSLTHRHRQDEQSKKFIFQVTNPEKQEAVEPSVEEIAEWDDKKIVQHFRKQLLEAKEQKNSERINTLLEKSEAVREELENKRKEEKRKPSERENFEFGQLLSMLKKLEQSGKTFLEEIQNTEKNIEKIKQEYTSDEETFLLDEWTQEAFTNAEEAAELGGEMLDIDPSNIYSKGNKEGFSLNTAKGKAKGEIEKGLHDGEGTLVALEATMPIDEITSRRLGNIVKRNTVTVETEIEGHKIKVISYSTKVTITDEQIKNKLKQAGWPRKDWKPFIEEDIASLRRQEGTSIYVYADSLLDPRFEFVPYEYFYEYFNDHGEAEAIKRFLDTDSYEEFEGRVNRSLAVGDGPSPTSIVKMTAEQVERVKERAYDDAVLEAMDNELLNLLFERKLTKEEIQKRREELQEAKDEGSKSNDYYKRWKNILDYFDLESEKEVEKKQ